MKIHLWPLSVAGMAVFIGLLAVGPRPCAAGPIVEFDFVPAPSGSLGSPTGVLLLDSTTLICQPGSTFTTWRVFDLSWAFADNLDSPTISGSTLNWPFQLTMGSSDLVVQQWSVAYEQFPGWNYLDGGYGAWVRSSPDVPDAVPTAAMLIVSVTALGAVARWLELRTRWKRIVVTASLRPEFGSHRLFAMLAMTPKIAPKMAKMIIAVWKWPKNRKTPEHTRTS